MRGNWVHSPLEGRRTTIVESRLGEASRDQVDSRSSTHVGSNLVGLLSLIWEWSSLSLPQGGCR